MLFLGLQLQPKGVIGGGAAALLVASQGSSSVMWRVLFPVGWTLTQISRDITSSINSSKTTLCCVVNYGLWHVASLSLLHVSTRRTLSPPSNAHYQY